MAEESPSVLAEEDNTSSDTELEDNYIPDVVAEWTHETDNMSSDTELEEGSHTQQDNQGVSMNVDSIMTQLKSDLRQPNDMSPDDAQAGSKGSPNKVNIKQTLGRRRRKPVRPKRRVDINWTNKLESDTSSSEDEGPDFDLDVTTTANTDTRHQDTTTQKQSESKPESKPVQYDFELPEQVSQVDDDGVTQIKVYLCTICDKACRNRPSYIAHYKSCSSYTEVEKQYTMIDDKYSCLVCGKLYLRRISLVHHMRLHAKTEKYRCKVCNRQFMCLKSLRGHALIHTGERPYVCDVCGYTFRDKNTLRKHHRRHGDPAEMTFHCPNCPKRFFQITDLNKHKKIHSSHQFQCDVCAKQFYLKTSLTRHLSTHMTVKPYKCDMCTSCFGDRAGLRDHMRIHLYEKSHVCEVCGQGFVFKAAKDKHMKRHDKESRTCLYCLEMFADADKLTEHQVRHTGDEPYECIVCLEHFSDVTELKSHRKYHVKNGKYPCESCGKVYTRNEAKQIHMRKVHQIFDASYLKNKEKPKKKRIKIDSLTGTGSDVDLNSKDSVVNGNVMYTKDSSDEDVKDGVLVDKIPDNDHMDLFKAF